MRIRQRPVECRPSKMPQGVYLECEGHVPALASLPKARAWLKNLALWFSSSAAKAASCRRSPQTFRRGPDPWHIFPHPSCAEIEVRWNFEHSCHVTLPTARPVCFNVIGMNWLYTLSICA